MSKVSKILMMVFLGLLLVIVGEIGYYAGSKARGKEAMPEPVPAETKPAATVSPVPRLGYVSNKIVTSSLTTTVYQGKIAVLDFTGGILQNTGFIYKLKLVLQKDQDRLERYFNEDEVGRFKIFSKKGQQEVPLRFEDLQVGDSVILAVSVDHKKETDLNLINAKIEKIP